MSVSEFDIISRYFTDIGPQRDDVLVDIGDDAAIVHTTPGHVIVTATATTNTASSDPTDDEPAAIGHRTLATAIQRLAARGVPPAWFTLALTLPTANESWLQAFSDGLKTLAQRTGTRLIGGDTTRGPMTVTVCCNGVIPAGTALDPYDVHTGDHLYITGTLGAGTIASLGAAFPAAFADEERRKAVKNLQYPQPRMDFGGRLHAIVRAAADLSAGLQSALMVLMERSGHGACLEHNRLPLSPGLEQLLSDRVHRPAFMGIGGDYELLLCVPEENAAWLRSLASRLNVPVTYAGLVTREPGIRWQ